MSHSEIAPHSDHLAMEPVVRRSRAEIIDRYRRFRAISIRHNSGALKCLSSEALMEQARRLGIARGRTLILNSEDELTLVYDLALYARQGGRKRPLDRYAASQRFAPDSDEARVLDAMLAARFALIRVERRHSEAGLIVRDLMREEEFWLVDEGMESSAPIGLRWRRASIRRVISTWPLACSSLWTATLLTNALERRPVLLRMNLDQKPRIAASPRRSTERPFGPA